MPYVKKHYNELYYIYKNKYNKEINSLNTDDKESFDYKNLWLSDYTYLSEEEQEEEQKEEQKEQKKNINLILMNILIGWVIRKTNT